MGRRHEKGQPQPVTEGAEFRRNGRQEGTERNEDTGYFLFKETQDQVLQLFLVLTGHYPGHNDEFPAPEPLHIFGFLQDVDPLDLVV